MTDIAVKKVERFNVALIEAKGSFEKIPALMGEIYDWIARNGIEPAGPPMGIYYDDPKNVALEDYRYAICAPIHGAATGDERVQVHEIPAADVACIVHTGPYADVGQAWQQLSDWILAEQYQFAGPGRELYLNDPQTTAEDALLTEVQIPVKR